MSSLRSSNAPVTAALLERLPEVVSTVAEQMFFGWAEPCDEQQVETLLRSGATSPVADWVRVEIVFRGALEGSLHVALPPELARDLGSAMLGSDEELTTELLNDVGGELANVVGGALLTRGEPSHQFQLLPPRVSRGSLNPEGEIGHASCFVLNDQPMMVRLEIHESAG